MNTLTKSLTGLGLGAALTLTAGTAMAAGGCGTFTNAEGVEEHLACSSAPIDFTNKGSLQNGAKMFMNYCAGCHSAKYVRHSRIAKDLEIPPELVEKYQVHVLPLTVHIGDASYKDGETITLEKLYEGVDGGGPFPSTSQVNPNEFHEVYQKRNQDYS